MRIPTDFPDFLSMSIENHYDPFAKLFLSLVNVISSFLLSLLAKLTALKNPFCLRVPKTSIAQLCHLPESLQNFSINVDSVRDIKIIDVKSLIIKRVAMY